MAGFYGVRVFPSRPARKRIGVDFLRSGLGWIPFLADTIRAVEAGTIRKHQDV